MEKIKIKSKQDGLDLYGIILEPEKEAKGIVQISHGMAEHKERYIDFMEFLTQNGYVTVIHDHRGHGQSIKNKEELGYFYEEKAEAIVEDLHQITLEMKERYPELPVYLLGHSMGSMVVRKYCKKYDHEIVKLIVCGSPSENKMASFAIGLVKFLKLMQGDKYRSELIQNLAFYGYNQKLQGKSPNRWISENKANVKAYDQDEFCGFHFTLNGFQNLFTLMKDIYDPKGWKKENLNLPILFVAGKQDPVIKSEKDWKKSQEFLKKIGYQKIDSILYPKMRHEILNEIDHLKVYQDLLDWIEKKDNK